MTRFLSDALQAREPFFRSGLKSLETSYDRNMDIRFSTHIRHSALAKMRELGLDPNDTTPEELYHLLQQRLQADDVALTRRLRTEAATHVSAEADVIAGMVHVLRQLPDSKQCFALKSSSLRSMLRKQPPKKAMKQLGYRSLDSFLKHETSVSILAAAWLSEGTSWRQRLLDQYKQLKAADFEMRDIIIAQPDSKRWRELAEHAVKHQRQTFLAFKELGALVFLPLSSGAPDGAVTASLSLALHELNQIRAGSTFLKLCQVRPDFGSQVKLVARDELHMGESLLGQPISWSLIQRYYARLTEQFREELFEPHIRLEDMAWHPIEQTLSAIEPSLSFWKNTSHLGVLHNRQPVSFNIVDVAVSYCNQLPFEQRMAHYFRQSLWHELMLQYLPHEKVEQTVTAALQPNMKLAKDTVPA